jgi:nucleotidyltransferase substrate binding protein (TIGR01987 family)
MKKEIKLAIEKLEKAVRRLREGAASSRDELDKDGVIQRFEFSFELLWKTLKIFLEGRGVDVKTPKDALKEAFRLEWIEDEDVYLDMLDDRNRTSHIYDQKTSREIFLRIVKKYLPAMKLVVAHLKGLS